MGFLASSACDCANVAALLNEVECESSCDGDCDIISGGPCDWGSSPSQNDLHQNACAYFHQQRQKRRKHSKMKQIESKYRHQDKIEREMVLQVSWHHVRITLYKAVLQLLGSTGAEGHRKQLRALEKKAKKTARIQAESAREARFFQAEPLSPEFELSCNCAIAICACQDGRKNCK